MRQALSQALSYVVTLIRRVVRNDQLVLALLAMLIGAGVGVGVIAFRSLLAAVQFVFYGFTSEQVLTYASALPWWHILLAPTIGGLLVGILLQYVMPGGRPQGVPHVMEASALRSGRMSLRTGLAAALVSATSLGVGASTGREGPAVHLGATIGSLVAQWLRLSTGLSRTLLGCGVAAAVATSFNAPIAGVFFAVEVVIGHYALRAFAPVVISAVSATIVTRLHYGDFPAFVLQDTIGFVSFFRVSGLHHARGGLRPRRAGCDVVDHGRRKSCQPAQPANAGPTGDRRSGGRMHGDPVSPSSGRRL